MSQGATVNKTAHARRRYFRERRNDFEIIVFASSGVRFTPWASVTTPIAWGMKQTADETVTATAYKPNCLGAINRERMSWSRRWLT